MSKILLFHSDRKESEKFREAVISWGYACDVATSAADTFQALAKPDAPAIVVIDLGTMRSDAPEISARLGRLQAERPLQVLVVTDQPVEEMRKAFPAMVGCVQPDDILTKPIEARQLQGKLRSAERMLALQTDLAQASHALRYFSTHDSLTSLTLRQSAVEMLKQETQRSIRTHAPISLLMLDVDLFHEWNGKSGFDVGDVLLREVGLRLRRCMRGYDYASRYGNDEFLVLLPECSLADAARQAYRLQNEVFGPKFLVGEDKFSLSACIAVTESFGRHPSAVLSELEVTLHKAKQKGTSTVECAQDPGVATQPSNPHVGHGRAQARFSFDDSDIASPLIQ